ncbi:MAG TPA: ATP-dependent DNA ligase [Actinomycetota bacterium]|nr:ATP-dependent DNA ligase [Actinomycetota bacterium]
MDLPFDPPLAPMEAKVVSGVPTGDGWQYEPKWDGFRAICFRAGDDVYISSRKELPFARYFPEVVEALKNIAAPRLVLDGELVVFTPDGRGLDFDVLQQRLHPAESRVRKLSKETPASFIAFDLLALADRDLRGEPLAERRAALERTMAGARPPLYLSPRTSDHETAESWLDEFVVAGLDGVVAKRLDGVYRSGEREMRKVKRERTAECVLIGWRWAKDQRGTAVGSLILGMYGPDGELGQVGFTSGFARRQRREMVPSLEEHRSGPTVEIPNTAEYRSRWATDRDLSFEPLKPDLVVEVSFDQVTAGRIRHGARFLRWRPDKPAEQCTSDQLANPAGPDIRELVR